MLKKQLKEILGENSSFIIQSPSLNVYVSDNELKSYNPASIIKLFILYGALKKIDDQKADFSDFITIPENEKVPGSGVLKDMYTTKLPLIDLLTLMITVSDNTATNLILDHISIPYIQEALQSLSIKDTFVRRKLYHMIPGVFNEATPADVYLILEALFNGTGLTERSHQTALSILKKQQHHYLTKNILKCGTCGHLLKSNYCTCQCYAGDIDPVELTMYSKTGEITGHVHDAGIMIVDDVPVYVIVMTSHQNNNQETKDKISLVGETIYQYIKDQIC